MNRLVPALCLCVALGAFACDRQTAPDAVMAPTGLVAGGVTATRVATGVELYNGSETVIAYQVVNHGWLGLLASCADAGITCATLAQGERRVVPASAIYGGDTSPFTQARVMFWSVVQGGTMPGASTLLVTM